MSGSNNEPPAGQNQSQALINRKWKLKNAELKVVDIYSKTTSKLSPLIIKLEIKLIRATGDITKFVGKYQVT